MFSLNITDHPDGARLSVRVKTRASRSSILETRDGQLVVALAAPPVDGEANLELLRLLSSATGLPKSRVSLAAGHKSRNKLVQFTGLRPAELQTRLQALVAPPAGK